MPTKSAPRARRVSAAQFARMTAAQKRRAIARDVLARLDASQLRPATGKFVQVRNGAQVEDLQAALAKNTRCEVCALGGAICGLAHFEDKVQLKYNEYLGRLDLGISILEPTSALDRRIRKIFGERQLIMIEFAFEGGGGAIDIWDLRHLHHDIDKVDDIEYALMRFHNSIPSERKRFRAIWQKIADHPKGLFQV